MSAGASIEARLSAVEAAVDELRRRTKPVSNWLDLVIGSQAGYPEFEEVVALGRAIRDSDRPRDEPHE